MSAKIIRTRLLIIFDIHIAFSRFFTDLTYVYRLPLLKADMLLYAGDIINVNYLSEYKKMFDILKTASVELKLIILNNYNITLHKEFYIRGTKKDKYIRRGDKNMKNMQKIKEMWMNEEARKSGFVYLEEGIRTFKLRNEARFIMSSFISVWGDWKLFIIRNHYLLRLVKCTFQGLKG